MSDEKKITELTSELKAVVSDAVETAETLADRKQTIENLASDEAIQEKVEAAIKATPANYQEKFQPRLRTPQDALSPTVNSSHPSQATMM